MDSLLDEPTEKQKAEQRLKDAIASKPFNLSIIRNPNNIKIDTTDEPDDRGPLRSRRGKKQHNAPPAELLSPDPRRKAPPKEEPRPDDEMQVFTHFLLGKKDLDEKEKEALRRQQNDHELMLLLHQKEKEISKGIDNKNDFKQQK